MSEERGMKPVSLNKELFAPRFKKVDPAYKQITEGLLKEIDQLIRDPTKIGVSCCVEGCCVSWCCVQLS